MKENDLLISRNDGEYAVKVSGRANFEYAVPLRELANSLETGFKAVRFEMSECQAMDSTFMGVLSMIGLKARRGGAVVEIVKANDFLRKLLRDLGITKLFDFTDEFVNMPAEWSSAAAGSDLLAAAETVSEAHEKLVEADQANQAKFSQVIEFARKDVERLKGKISK